VLLSPPSLPPRWGEGVAPPTTPQFSPLGAGRSSRSSSSSSSPDSDSLPRQVSTSPLFSPPTLPLSFSPYPPSPLSSSPSPPHLTLPPPLLLLLPYLPLFLLTLPALPPPPPPFLLPISSSPFPPPHLLLPLPAFPLSSSSYPSSPTPPTSPHPNLPALYFSFHHTFHLPSLTYSYWLPPSHFPNSLPLSSNAPPSKPTSSLLQLPPYFPSPLSHLLLLAPSLSFP
jgi:hypothetical protein